jgi:hypothetical protein
VYVDDEATTGLNLYTAIGGVASAFVNDLDLTDTAPLTYTFTGLLPVTTYYVSVWAVEPVSSFLYNKAPLSFTTGPGTAVYTPHLYPINGAYDVPVKPNFAWDAVPGATGYEFRIVEGSVLPSGTATVLTFNSYTPAAALKNMTTYTWQVRAMTGSIAGDWITSVFTTVKAPEPVVTVPPATTTTVNTTSIIIPTQTPAPVPTINLPQPTVIVNPAPITVTIPPGTTMPVPTLVMPEAQTPVYIWIIVAVGALLTVAVIVLIIRTRRVV